jgi:hypothetical protein
VQGDLRKAGRTADPRPDSLVPAPLLTWFPSPLRRPKSQPWPDTPGNSPRSLAFWGLDSYQRLLDAHPLDSLLIDFRLASQPVWCENHRHPGDPVLPNPASGVTYLGACKLPSTPRRRDPEQDGISSLIGSSCLWAGTRTVICDWTLKRGQAWATCACAVCEASLGGGA